jgi:hypothetical protein
VLLAGDDDEAKRFVEPRSEFLIAGEEPEPHTIPICLRAQRRAKPSPWGRR